jgi:hypothetical protein
MHRVIVNSALDILDIFSKPLILLDLFNRESFLIFIDIVMIPIINVQFSFIKANEIWTFTFSFFENLSSTNVNFFLLILFKGSIYRFKRRRRYSYGAYWLTTILLRRSILDLLVRVLY